MATHGIRGKRRSIVHKGRGLGWRVIILSVVHAAVKLRYRWNVHNAARPESVNGPAEPRRAARRRLVAAGRRTTGGTLG